MALLKELNDLVNTAPALADPEDDVHEDTKAKVVDSFKEDYADIAVSKLRGKTTLPIEDKKYAGRKVSRKDLNKDDSPMTISGGSSVEGSEGDVSQDDDIEESDGDYNEEEAADEEGDTGDIDSDEGGGDEESDVAEEDDADKQSLDDSVVHKFSAVDVSGEVKKGKAVHSQLLVWDSILELRIQLQKLLVLANRFPHHSRFSEFQSAALAQDKKNRSLFGQG